MTAPGPPRSALLAIALILGGACSPSAPAPDPADGTGPLSGRNLLFVTLDTTRADHLSCYGGPRGLTPHLDALAASGVRFDRATSQTNSTNSSHTALFSGLPAIESGVFNNETTLPEGVDVLPEAFRRAGYRTGGFPAIPHVSSALLDLPGFEETYALAQGISASEVTDRALDWIESVAGEPFFAWVHYFDPHTPYAPPTPIARLFYEGDPRGGDRPPLDESPAFARAPAIARRQFTGVRDPEYPRAMYRAEVHYTDREVGRLLDRLEALGIAPDTAVIVVADHGETLGEHRILYSHETLFETNLRIPFLARLPGFPGGIVVDAPVTHLDVAPTVAELFDVRLEDGRPRTGRSLVPWLRGKSPGATERVTVQEHADNRQVAVRRGPWKYVHRVAPGEHDLPAEMLFRLDRDPRELRNLVDRDPGVAAALRAHADPWIRLGEWRRSNPRPGPGASEEEIREFERMRRMLGELGYLDDPPGEDGAPVARDPEEGG